MSMTRSGLARRIEQGDFSVFTKVPETQLVRVASYIIDFYSYEFFYSPNPDAAARWLEFMRYLNDTPQKILKMPDYMVGIFRQVMANKPASGNANERCAQLLLMMLNELEKTPSYSLAGNKLFLLVNGLLRDLKDHTAVLDLVETMPVADKKKVYSHLLDQYIAHPDLLYQMYKSGQHPMLFRELAASTDDEDKLFFLERMKEIFENAKQEKRDSDVWSICRFLTHLNDNVLAIPDLGKEELKELYKLKRMTTQSEKVLEKVYTLIRHDEQAVKKLVELRSSEDNEEILKFTNKMARFLDGFGNVDYEEGLLTSAQISSRKKYEYDPVVLQIGQFENFLKVLQEAPKPIRKRFILTGNHWIAGDIEIDADGHARTALFDSLGGFAQHETAGIYEATRDVMQLLNHDFPRSPIYFAEEKRQHTPTGCSVFAQDDTAHLFKLEAHLGQNLFDYFAAQHKPVAEIHPDGSPPIAYYRCNMPLSLMRTAQSESTLEKLKKESVSHVLALPVKGTGEKFTASINDKEFGSVGKFFKPKPKGEKGSINTRLEYELEKMAKYNAIYLLTHSPEEIASQKAKFTLDAFEKECEEKRFTHTPRGK